MVFPSFPTKLGRCYPNVCTAETGSQLLTATPYYGKVGMNQTCQINLTYTGVQ
jgi:hypothetical protein